MPIPVVENIIKETRGHPYTMLTILGLVVCVWWLWTHVALAQDVRTVQQQVAQLSYDYTRGNLETRFEAVERELFNLNQKVKEKTLAHQPVDEVYYTQINKLEIEKEQLERKLGAIK
jgi:hypothetical protein